MAANPFPAGFPERPSSISDAEMERRLAALHAAKAREVMARSRQGIIPFSFVDLERGVPAVLAREAEAQGLTRDDIRMIIPDRTLDRRIATGEPLKLEEADGIARLLRVVGMARRVFGDNALADEWLRTANPALDNHVPIRMARSDLGGREVEAVLGRIEHGVFG